MTFVLFAFGVSLLFFAGSLAVLNYGRHLGLRYLERHGEDSMTGLPAAEGAVFALTGLLIAFSISGALQRFDERRQLVLQEATAVSTAFDRLGVFEAGTAQQLRSKLKEYVRARIELYHMPHDFSLFEGTEEWSSEQREKSIALKKQVWDAALVACPRERFDAACSLALSALGSVFDAARSRLGAAERHPPKIVYIMLLGLGLGASLLAGFGMAPAKGRSWIHMVVFAGALAATLYVITDIEFPRLGLVHIEDYDHFLRDVYDHMVAVTPAAHGR